jgi:CBS domain-containing protein
MSVGAVCNRNVVILENTGSVQEAAELMRDHHVGDVVVVRRQGLVPIPVGIVTDRDIVVELIAKKVDVNSVAVTDIMSAEILTLKENEQLLDAVEAMRKRGVRRAPVVNTSGGLEGILSVDDIIELIAEQVSGLVSLIHKEQKQEINHRK